MRLRPVLLLAMLALAGLAASPRVGAGLPDDRAAEQGDRPLPAAATTQLVQAQVDVTRQMAAMMARMGQLEEEIRRLRGRVDELEHQAGSSRPQTAAPAAVAPSPTLGAAAADRTPGPLDTPPASARDAGAPPPPTDTAALEPIRIDPTAPARVQYDAALQLLQRGEFDQAQQAFDGMLRRYPNDALAPNAAYWLGETYYIRKDYTDAAAVFARNYRTYGADAQKAPDNLLKLGMALSALGDRDRACQTFAELARRHRDAAPPIQQTLVRERAATGCS